MNLSSTQKLDTIFEDLPYPINEPYAVDPYFDLPPIPLDRSEAQETRTVSTFYVTFIIKFVGF